MRFGGCCFRLVGFFASPFLFPWDPCCISPIYPVLAVLLESSPFDG